MVLGSNKKLILCLVCIVMGFCILEINIYNSYSSNIGNVFLSCDNYEFSKGDEFEVVVNLENNKVSAFTSNLYFDDSKVEFISGPDNINLIGDHIVYVWYDVSGGNNPTNGEIARFKFRAKDNGIANFVIDGDFYSQEDLIEIEFKQLQLNIGDLQRDVKKNEELGTDTQVQNANLQSLRLNKEGLIPNFQNDIHQYYLTVLNDVNDIDVIAISENPNATIEIIGNTNLKEGLNTILIKVFSQDKKTNNIYTINVTKTSDIELANNNLEILAIENVLLYPQFETSVTNYKAEVSNDISSLNILAIPENENAIVQINGKDDLKQGNNIINISVMAPNGFSERNYSVNVYKRNLEEENKYLEELKNNKEKLDEIYETERINSDSENEKDKQEIKGKQRNIIIFLFFVIIVASCVGIVYVLKKKKKI